MNTFTQICFFVTVFDLLIGFWIFLNIWMRDTKVHRQPTQAEILAQFLVRVRPQMDDMVDAMKCAVVSMQASMKPLAEFGAKLREVYEQREFTISYDPPSEW